MTERIGQYTGPALVAGSMIGQRRFGLDPSTGDLRSPLVGVGVLPGENRAVHAPVIANFGSVSTMCRGVASAGCRCGFYAYTSAEHDEYSGINTVRALVEGTGRVTVGIKGFRAEKMRVIGVVVPRRLSVHWKSRAFVLALLLFSTGSFLFHGTTPAWLRVFGLCLNGISGIALARSVFLTPGPSARTVRRFRQLYPGVKIWRTYEQALANCPLSEPPAEVIEAQKAEEARRREELKRATAYLEALKLQLIQVSQAASRTNAALQQGYTAALIYGSTTIPPLGSHFKVQGGGE